MSRRILRGLNLYLIALIVVLNAANLAIRVMNMTSSKSEEVLVGKTLTITQITENNAFDAYNYVQKPNLQGDIMPDTSHLKYLVIHESDNTSSGATAEVIYNYMANSKNSNATWIVDDNTVIQGTAMNIKSMAIRNTDFSKSDVSDDNSVNIMMATTPSVDYMKTVANTVYLVREILTEYPKLELARHADAYTERYKGNSVQKMCPRIMMSETTWWSWERFVYFATNPELPIPYMDFNPEISSDIPSSIKSLDIMK